MKTYPPVYPSDVEYRPGRIQSLDAEQELLLKQCWATLLKHWGYVVDISNEDVCNKNAFVVSSVVLERKPMHGSDAGPKKKRSLFSKKVEERAPIVELSNIRASALKHNRLPYRLELTCEEDLRTFARHQKTTQIDEAQIGDEMSVESFQTASDSLEGTLIEASNSASDTRDDTKQTQNDESRLQRSEVLLFLDNYNPSDTHNCLEGTLKNDLIDNFILRFVRARANNHEETMKMLVKSLHWRKHEVAVESLLREGDAPSVVTGNNPGFVKNFVVNKAFVRGQDRNKNPLFIFQSRKHFASDSSLAGTERYALLIIEWCRLFLREVNESVDLCSLMFDLSGFSLKNADNAPVKFLTSIFEAHYPESLGVVIVHNAPWIFSTVWSIIKNWLDPVVASKIHFTKGYEELQKFIEPKHIPQYLGGEDQKELSYATPGPEHTRPMKPKDAKYFELRKERDGLFLKIIGTTSRWVSCTDSESSSKYLKEKIYLSYQLSDNYIELDPYLRNPGVYDRDGTLNMKN